MLHMRTTFFLCFLVFAFTFTQAQEIPRSIIDIEYNDNFDGFELLKPELEKNRVFFTGENHAYYESNMMLELKMFKYLHNNDDFNVFLFEFGAGAAWLIQQYVVTGDSSLLKDMQHLPFSKYDKLFNGLRDYYIELPEDRKFRIEGIDREASYELATNALVRMLPEERGRPHDSIVIHIDALRLLKGHFDQNKDGNISLMGNRVTESSAASVINSFAWSYSS